MRNASGVITLSTSTSTTALKLNYREQGRAPEYRAGGVERDFFIFITAHYYNFYACRKKIPVEDDGERSLNLINPILIVATVLGRDCTHVTSCIENGVHPEENNLSPTNYLNYARVLLELS